MTDLPEIHLGTPLSLKSSFRYPIQQEFAKQELLIGALWLLVPVIGWIINVGYCIMMVHRMQHAEYPWREWRYDKGRFYHGFLTLLGMVAYHSPSAICGYLARQYESTPLMIASIVLWVIATIAVPGFMSHYCLHLDPREIFDPLKALRRIWQGGAAYWKAWSIALAALLLSPLASVALGISIFFAFVQIWLENLRRNWKGGTDWKFWGIALSALLLPPLGLLGFVGGFLFISVWFWQVAGFSFATVFSQLEAGKG